jgi:hypothetical protein
MEFDFVPPYYLTDTIHMGAKCNTCNNDLIYSTYKGRIMIISVRKAKRMFAKKFVCITCMSRRYFFNEVHLKQFAKMIEAQEDKIVN